jgi:hydrogenase maturation protein HypF
MVRALVADLRRGEDPGRISSRFHETLARAARAMIERAAREGGTGPVVLTGGCFQNARLAESVAVGLRGRHEVIRHGTVPPGDGGIALGQATVAAARIEEDAPCV